MLEALGLLVQITIQNIDLKDFVDIAVHIDKSDAVAIVDTRIIADLGLDGPDGVVVDSGKRVYIGETEIQAPGFSIWAGTSTSMCPSCGWAKRPSLIQRSAAAFQKSKSAAWPGWLERSWLTGP